MVLYPFALCLQQYEHAKTVMATRSLTRSLGLTLCILVASSTVICYTNPFVILGVSRSILSPLFYF